jgi:hypothetical protein
MYLYHLWKNFEKINLAAVVTLTFLDLFSNFETSDNRCHLNLNAVNRISGKVD